MVDGDNDYVNTSSGARAEVFPQEKGAGEEVTRISEIKGVLPVTLFERFLDWKESLQSKPAPVAKPVPAIYFPGSGGPSGYSSSASTQSIPFSISSTPIARTPWGRPNIWWQ